LLANSCTMSIPEPKVEHHEGRGIRSCPIFPELRPILDEAFEIFWGQERLCGRSSAVPRRSQHSDGLSPRYPTWSLHSAVANTFILLGAQFFEIPAENPRIPIDSRPIWCNT
jgi:hypothetical protein